MLKESTSERSECVVLSCGLSCVLSLPGEKEAGEGRGGEGEVPYRKYKYVCTLQYVPTRIRHGFEGFALKDVDRNTLAGIVESTIVSPSISC